MTKCTFINKEPGIVTCTVCGRDHKTNGGKVNRDCRPGPNTGGNKVSLQFVQKPKEETPKPKKCVPCGRKTKEQLKKDIGRK